jgi:hypothetical protein
LEGRGRTAGHVQGTVYLPVNAPDGIVSPASRPRSPFPRLSTCLVDGLRIDVWLGGRRGVFVFSRPHRDIGHLFLGDEPDLADSRVNITVVELPLEAGFSSPNRSPWGIHLGEAETFPLRSHCLHSRWFGSVDACSASKGCGGPILRPRSPETVLACRDQWESKRWLHS